MRFRIGPLPSTLLEVLVWIAIALALAATRGRLAWRSFFTWPGALLLLGATLGVFASPDRRAAAGIWKAYFVEPYLLAFVVATLAVTRDRIRLLLAGIAVAGLVAAVANLLTVGTALARHAYSVVTPPVAIYNSANDVAMFLVPLIAVAGAVVLYSDDRRDRLVAAGFAAVATAAVLASLSRAGLAALFASALLLALLHPRRWWLAGALAAVGAAVAGGVPTIRHRIELDLNPGSGANTALLRTELWRSSLRMLEHRPLFGAGLSGFRQTVRAYATPGYGEQLIYPHDIVLNFWSETGLLGAAGFIWLSAALARASLRGLRLVGMARVLSLGVLAALLAIWIHGLVDVPYFKNDLALAFWALVGLQAGAERSTRA